MKTSLFFLLFFSYVSLKAQVPDVIEIDSNTFEPMKTLPFDKRFILRVPIKDATKVTFVGLVRHDRNVDLASTITNNISINGSYQIPEIDSKFYEIRSNGKANFLQIDFRDNLLLDPSRRYTILFSTGVDDKIYSVFDSYHEIEKTPRISDTDKAKKIKELLKSGWNPISDDIKAKIGIRFGIIDVKGIDKVPDILDSVKNHIPKELSDGYKAIMPTLQSRDVFLDNLKLNINSSTSHVNFIGNATLSTFYKILSKEDTTYEKEYKKILLANKEQIQSIYNLISSNQDFFKELLSGAKSISCFDCKPTKDSQINARIVNLKKSVVILREIENTLFTITQTDGSFARTYSNIRRFIDELHNSINILSSIAKINDEVINILNKDPNLHAMQSINGNSFIIGFEARNKFAITPDFGLLTTIKPPKEFEQYPKLIPYLGFHINFRYIDKDQDFRSYRKKLPHFLSGFVGWSLKSVEDKDKGISNFFNNSSLITGLGIRLGNAARLTFSRLWYYQTAPNATTPSLKNFGLIGISLDGSLKDLMNGLNIFFPK